MTWKTRETQTSIWINKSFGKAA